jgi:hypothetical protein
MTKEDIIDNCELTFDPGDPDNGSLYLCQRGDDADPATRDRLIAELRADGLWSDETPKQVPDDHRAAYREQLEFIEAARYDVAGAAITLARFDHPKFPSSAARFAGWKAAFDNRYGSGA